ncbi:mitogen-activated protein kinase kinase kinase 15-like isoform X1 [Stegodyphus dumicola]|uniref:mitogen-activated protein kinase kinase kinase 15-like isoform X1 n=1 Tax=Stegodyphus dumicola TaxID=202533 RepID=UPI0015B1368A|nr:mitogen-activated protein kinase kinase kinase 15-like isoform X1 [Stegodyphus dumicola]XP_035233232.1 mitogen-activated protein kinase kinase kinase 15-like isoform X1 [Stegodyphus dumicola]
MTDSDASMTVISPHQRPKMDIACVIDLIVPEYLIQREKAYEEIQKACQAVGGTFYHIQFEKLDFGEMNVLDLFYNADVAIVDLSVLDQQSPLFYRLGVRESFGMKQNILLYNDCNPNSAVPLKLSCANYMFLSYKLNDSGQCVLTDPSGVRGADDGSESKIVLSCRLKKMLQEVEVQTKAHMKEKFLSDLRKARDSYTGEALSEVLQDMRKRLDDPNIISGDVALNMLISFREIQDYDSMVKLVDDLMTIPNLKFTFTWPIQHLYAFALNRRNKEGDREKALQVVTTALEKKENQVPDMICLCGRIYKDKFVESQHKDQDSLQNAIKWYRKGFEVQPNEYAGINLATLLVIAGNDFSKSSELQHIGRVLNNLIGRKGSLNSLKDYWDVATFFEISVLAEDYSKAIEASKCMFDLKPPNWYLKSTIGNIELINRFRRKPEHIELTAEEKIFNFWLEYFVAASVDEVSDVIRFPILILDPGKVYMPSYVTVNMGAEEKSVHIVNLCLEALKGICRKLHEWEFPASALKSVSLYKRDERCLFLYVHQNSDDFQMFFPSEEMRKRFYDLLLEMTADQEGIITDLNTDINTGVIKYEYELDNQKKRIVLGRGTYGIVYAARDLTTQVQIAIKEIPERDIGVVQPLHEEIKLHSELRHRNIVQYLGSISEDGYFKIFMERVPGGSLSQLLQNIWGPLKDNEVTISYYTKQILKGLKYLHDQQIVHRDIKGDNVLVNTYNGVVKISDFGTSKRLAGINPATQTFAGTLQYMAPEVIDKGQRGYGAPADIWSLGCTVVEMATGKPPFGELGSPHAAMFKVGFYKIHPEIPATMSERAKNFILRCFVADPDQRATAADLLEEPFILEPSGKKKTHRAAPPDFSRSISVPERVSKLDKPMNVERFASTGEESAAIVCKTSPSNSLRIPTPFTFSTDSSDSRRSSTGLLSPPIDSPQIEQEQGNFYLLKKDSQRRAIIVKILSENAEQICEIWMEDLVQKTPGLVLTMQHLRDLLEGLREYIPEQNKQPVQLAISHLKEEVEFDGIAVHQMHMALYIFQDAVKAILRQQNIMPHAVFALDNLVRSSVQAAVSILSPELGDNLEGKNYENEPEEVSTLGISTAASMKSSAQLYSNAELMELQQKYELLIKENLQLMKELVSTNELYQNLLKKMLEEKSSLIQLLKNRIYENSSSPGSSLEGMNSAISEAVKDSSFQELHEWLKNIGADNDTISKFAIQKFSKDDVLSFMTKEDLQTLGLSGGMRLKVWRALVNHRQKSNILSGES